MYTLFVAVLLFGFASCDLSIEKTKECGQITCDYLHYCSIIENSCRPCRKVCDVGNNQDVVLCNTHCQDYIHDTRYLKKEEIVDNGKEQIDKIQVLSTISLIFSLIVFICLVLVVLMFWYGNKTALSSFNINNRIFSKKEKPDISRKDDCMQMNSSEISTIKVQNDTVLNMQDITDILHKAVPPQDNYVHLTTFKNHHAKSEPDSASSVLTNKTNKTTQPLAKRLPSEDSTLDFIYDNPALAPSPVLDKEKGGSRDNEEVCDSGT